MEIEFLGAAQTVTGSMHLVRTKHATILLDCGLFQGRRRESFERNRNLPVDASAVDAVVLSHAHIDHSGALPLLSKRGFNGEIFATPATRDLCAVMLQDAAMIQEQDARYINRAIEKEGAPMDPVDALYNEKDVTDTLERMIAVPYRHPHPVAPGVRLTFVDAGHVLGSAVTLLDVEEDGQVKRLAFSGDLGRRHMPILRDPEMITGVHALILESTYGDRLHDPIASMDDALADVLKRTFERGGKVIIPSFALERAQEIVFTIQRLKNTNRMPPMRVYVDSPLTVKITDVFRMHPECFDEEIRRMLAKEQPPFDFAELKYIHEVEDSKALDRAPDPVVIISASGMCESGRIVHHLKAGIEDEKNTIVIVGFQAQHTLGRRLVEKRARVRIFGVERERRAEVVVLNGFSAHADQADLLAYAEQTRDHGPLRQIALVHGETRAQNVLRDQLTSRGFPSVHVPAPRDKVVV